MKPRPHPIAVLAAFLAVSFAAGLAAAGPIYGIKSLAPSGGAPSDPPADLYVFNADGTGYSTLGTVTLNGSQVDADALAISDAHGLLGYVESATGWVLSRISTATAAATPIGAPLAGRDIRGAVLDGADRLWVLDAQNDELLRVDPGTGAVLSSVGLTTASGPLPLGNTTDLAIRRDGLVVLSSRGEFYSLDVSTGSCALIGEHPANALAGLAFAEDAPPERMHGYEVNNDDDIFTYDTGSGFTPSLLIGDIIPAYNSGRGDLATRLDALPGGCNDADLAPPFGLLDLADVNAFIAGFNAMGPIADLNGDGVFDLNDVSLFITAFLAGCP